MLLLLVFWNELMLRDTARRLLLFFFVLDAFINPVGLASGKSRCSDHDAQKCDGLCLNVFVCLTLSTIQN
jgi:hypothetical protein